jgi:calpain
VIEKYDPHKTGYLSGFQLREALNTAGFKLNIRILNSIGNRYGTRDGSIAIDDFILCVVKIKTMLGKLK